MLHADMAGHAMHEPPQSMSLSSLSLAPLVQCDGIDNSSTSYTSPTSSPLTMPPSVHPSSTTPARHTNTVQRRTHGRRGVTFEVVSRWVRMSKDLDHSVDEAVSVGNDGDEAPSAWESPCP